MNFNLTPLSEAIAASAFPKASALIRSYLKRNVSPNTFTYPSPEHVVSGGKRFVGVRYFFNKTESVRFNWLSDASIDASKNLISVDYWDGTRFDGRPSLHVEFDHTQSLVKTLPLIASFLKAPSPGKKLWIEETSLVESVLVNMSSTFSNITEAGPKVGDAYQTINNVIRALKTGLNQKDIFKGGIATYGPGLGRVFDTIKQAYPTMFEKQGVSVVFKDSAAASKIDPNKIAAMIGVSAAVGATVTAGAPETYPASKEIEAMEENLPRLAFEEQLADLRRAMVLLMNNATQSLYLAGRGGIGKTQTVEEELHKRGLSDGNGYFKITGSASTAGIYRILYEHRNDILLFDDSDGALADQDSRNLFKAASDTKKVRKIAWMKAGKNYVDPEDMPEDDDDAGDMLPRYFDFKGKIIFISNLKLDKLDPDGALRTRGYIINVDPTDTEVYDYMLKIVDHIKLDVDFALSAKARREVVDVLRNRKAKEGTVNLRQLVRGLNTRAGIEKDGGTDWIGLVQRYA